MRQLINVREFIHESLLVFEDSQNQESGKLSNAQPTESTNNSAQDRLSFSQMANKYLRSARGESIERVKMEVIYSISIFHPRSGNWRKKQIQVLDVLGSNTIKELHDSIFCLVDFIHLGEAAAGGRSQLPRFSFIESTFYIDTEHINDLDSIKQSWAQIGKEFSDVPNFQTASIDTKLQDILICVDEHYLYHHQGDCGHLLVVNQIKIVDFELERPLRVDYPVVVRLSKIVIPNCCICEIDKPKYAVYSDLGPYMGSLWCHPCFTSFFNDGSGHIQRDIEYYSFRIDYEF